MTENQFALDKMGFPSIDFDAMTWGEVEDFLDAAGWGINNLRSFMAAGRIDFNAIEMKAVTALVWAANRPNMPGLTLEAVRNIPAPKMIEILGRRPAEDDTPKEPGTKTGS